MAVGAAEALLVPWLILVRHTAGGNHLFALCAPRRELLLIARRAINIVILRNETLRSDWALAMRTAEALVMPLLALVFHLFHTSSKDFIATVAPRRKCLIIAIRAEDAIIL